jgi:hypothetical protein
MVFDHGRVYGNGMEEQFFRLAIALFLEEEPGQAIDRFHTL